MAWPYGLLEVPSSWFFTMTAFLPAYRPVSRTITLPGCAGEHHSLLVVEVNV